ncbi:MAG TPA: helix-turn-helix transcriptional regulator [Woeseiaceae bacterium]|nr:helix-turn-helix transcriptional regulator [Woeseiaceae bacterium]
MTAYAPKIPSILSRVRELEARPEPIVAFAREYPTGHLVERHRHERAQLIYASHGVMRVDTAVRIWVVPPLRAIWMPPGIDHEIRASSTVCLRTLFIHPDLRSSLPQDCCVIEISPLLRELILRMVTLAESKQHKGSLVHLVELILGEIREIPGLSLHIPMPADQRALRVCKSILDNPADGRTCAQWGASVGASARTLERLFQNEAGISFGAWRRQVRLLAALTGLAAKIPVANVASDLGYESASAFSAMFKRTLGCPPSQFFG